MADVLFDVTDDGSLHKYRTEIPNTVIKGLKGRTLSPMAKWLYVYLKSVAGDRGECRQSISILVAATGLSRGQVSKERRALRAVGLITITEGRRRNRDPDLLRIVDVWPENMQEFASFGVHEVNTSHEPLLQQSVGEEHAGVHEVNSGVHEVNSGVHGTLYGRTRGRRSLGEEEKQYTVGFLAYHAAHPVKKGKANAWRIWQRQKLEPLAATIVQSVHDHLKYDPQWARGYIKHLDSYLNAKGWEDELDIETSGHHIHTRMSL